MVKTPVLPPQIATFIAKHESRMRYHPLPISLDSGLRRNDDQAVDVRSRLVTWNCHQDPDCSPAVHSMRGASSIFATVAS